jgi:hypothetical protein
MVEPHCIADDIGRESVALVGIHPAILPIWAINLAIPDSLTVHILPVVQTTYWQPFTRASSILPLLLACARASVVPRLT